ncbi:LysM domain-containing protein [Streptomyces sp. BK208]|uniref:transglycosylase family protein n=1 Tax=Streptomyces sp. BK208 TaxID=2512150 RepID=UPI00105DB1BC|nr:transglycosylase family protein [Streptomyces sp. BK208]TDT24471.1 LysM domain-containing protein [Streptomyces sp. BK208]
MLSGNGRHRRPRQAPALVVAAGVTGSAIAIPLLGATGAHAADSAAWDQVAECETGGAWSQNSGNGYYGGLQLSQEAWERYGGLDYAPSADEASRSQQIRIAEKVHADQGIAAWPTCGLLAGLGNDSGVVGGGSAGDGASEGSGASGKTDGSGSAETPATTETPDASRSSESSRSSETSGASRSSGSSGSSESTGSSGKSDSGDANEAPSSSPSPSSSPTGTPSGTSSGDAGSSTKSDTSAESDPGARAEQQGTEGASGSGRHRGDSAEEAAGGKGRADETAGRHASRDGEPREVEDGAYTVRSGDSLWAIADSLDVDGGWHALYAGNKTVVGADPDHILPGQTLTVTGESVEK